MPEPIRDPGLHLQALIFCESVNADTSYLPERTILNRVITVALLPTGATSLPVFTVYALLWGSAHGLTFNFEWLGADDEVLATFDLPIPGERDRMLFDVVATTPAGLPIRGPGRYEMRMLLRGQHLGSGFMAVELVDGLKIGTRPS